MVDWALEQYVRRSSGPLRRGEGRFDVRLCGASRINGPLWGHAVDDLKNAVAALRLQTRPPASPGLAREGAESHGAGQVDQASREQQRGRKLAEMHRDLVTGFGVLGEDQRVVIVATFPELAWTGSLWHRYADGVDRHARTRSALCAWLVTAAAYQRLNDYLFALAVSESACISA